MPRSRAEGSPRAARPNAGDRSHVDGRYADRGRGRRSTGRRMEWSAEDGRGYSDLRRVIDGCGRKGVFKNWRRAGGEASWLHQEGVECGHDSPFLFFSSNNINII